MMLMIIIDDNIDDYDVDAYADRTSNVLCERTMMCVHQNNSIIILVK